jgi:5-methylthioadenosine/S-adenosylhomocysteine deaminase
MRLAAYPLAARCGPGTLDARAILAMATVGGAQAAGDPTIGTIEVGTRADLIVLDPDSPSLAPTYDPISTVAYSAGRGDVRWVVAGGRVVVDDRRLTTIDVDAAIDEVRAVAGRIAS